MEDAAAADAVGLDIGDLVGVEQRGAAVAVHGDAVQHGRRGRRGGCGLGGAAPERLTDAVGVEGLEQVVVRAQLEGTHGVVRVGRGEDDLRLRHQTAGEGGNGRALHIAEMDIEKENVECVLFQQLYRLRAASSLENLGVRQKAFNLAHKRHTGIFFIVDHGNTHQNTLLLFSVRHFRRDERQRERHGRALVAAVDMKVALLAVNAAQAFSHVEKARVGRVVGVFEFFEHLRREAVALVAHADIGALVVLADADGHAPVVHGDKAVPHGVFHDGLQNERRQAQRAQIVRQLAFDVQRALKARLGQHEVVVHIGDLLLERDEGLVDRKRLAEVVGKDQNGLARAVGVRHAQRRDGVECVEEKMRVDLRLQRAEFRLLAQCDLMLGLTELQHDGEKLRKALERFDVRVQHKVRPRRRNEKQRADDLFVRDEGGGQHGAAVPLRDLHYDRFPLGHRLARSNGKGSDRQVTAACGEHLCSVGQRDLKVRELFAHNVHRALKILAVADALSQIRQFE